MKRVTTQWSGTRRGAIRELIPGLCSPADMSAQYVSASYTGINLAQAHRRTALAYGAGRPKGLQPGEKIQGIPDGSRSPPKHVRRGATPTPQ